METGKYETVSGVRGMLHLILEHVGNYLKGRTSVRDLETWLLSSLQAILDSREQDSIRLANVIDADLIELTDGRIDEDAFRERIAVHLKLLGTVSLTASTTHSTTTVRAAAITSGNIGTVTEWVAMSRVA